MAKRPAKPRPKRRAKRASAREPTTKARKRAKTKPKIGHRPTALNDETERLILTELARTGTYTMAAAAGGITADTLDDWYRRGDGTHPTRASTPAFVRFALGVDAAIAIAKKRHLHKIHRSKDWRAGAWALERLWPTEFGRVDRLKAEHSIGGDETKPPIRTANMTDDELETVIATLKRHQTAPDDEPDPTEPNPGDKE